MDISPASALQVMDGGDLVEVGDDVLGIARDIREIDPDLRLRYSERQNFWAVYQITKYPVTQEVRKKQLVTTSKTLHPGLVERVRKVTNPSYDLEGELRKIEAKTKRDRAHRQREEIGERAERLAHALRKDTLRHQRRIFVPDPVAATR